MNYICPWFGDTIPDRYIKCIEQSRIVAEDAGHGFDVVILPEVSDPHQAAIQKDIFVLDLARRMESAAFIDADVVLLSCPEIEKNASPYFIYEWDRPRIGYFIVNGCCDWFQRLEEEKQLRKIRDVFGYPNKLLRDKTTGRIPESSYIHYRFTSKNGAHYETQDAED